MFRPWLVFVLCLAATCALATGNAAARRELSSYLHNVRELLTHSRAAGKAPAPKPAPAPRPAPVSPPAPAPRPPSPPVPPPAPVPGPRPPSGGGSPQSVPAVPPPAPIRPPPGVPPNGPRPPPAPPVVRPAGVPSPIPYRPVTPVVYVQPTVVRPIVVQPVTYVYYPVYIQPIYYVRPVIVVQPTYWTTYPCYQTYCYYDYNRCMSLFGDSCFCYPGLLRCVQSSCYSYYQPIYDNCNQALTAPSRCVLSCKPAQYPLLPDPASSSVAAAPPQILYSVVTVVLIQGLNSSDLPNAEYDFAGAVATSLVPANSKVERNNVTLQYRDVIINTTAFTEVTIGVAVNSLETMNATDKHFQWMMYGNITNNTLSQNLVKNNILFNETQLSYDQIKSNVFVSDENGTPPSTVGPIVSSTITATVAAGAFIAAVVGV